MTSRRDQLNRIEAAMSRLEEALAAHAAHLREKTAAARLDSAAARAAAEDALTAVKNLGQAIVPAVPPSPAGTSPAAGGEQEGEPAAARRARKTLQPPQDKM